MHHKQSICVLNPADSLASAASMAKPKAKDQLRVTTQITGALSRRMQSEAEIEQLLASYFLIILN